MYGRSWVPFSSGTQIFPLSHARDMLNIPSFVIAILVYERVTNQLQNGRNGGYKAKYIKGCHILAEMTTQLNQND